MALFAVVPAAGHSRRMGQPKLTMELAGRTVVAHLLAALDHPEIQSIVIVYRRDDEQLDRILDEYHCDRLLRVRPEVDPPDMRASVEAGVAAVRSAFQPQPDDGWLLIPADHPVVDAQVIDLLLPMAMASCADVLVPTYRSRRGHPTILKWSTTFTLADIPSGYGVNWLLKHAGLQIQEVELETDSILLDLDTPDDFQRLQQRLRD